MSNPTLLPGFNKLNYNNSTGDETSQEKRDEQSSLLFPDQQANSSFYKRKANEDFGENYHSSSVGSKPTTGTGGYLGQITPSIHFKKNL